MSQMPGHQSDTLPTPEEEALKSNTDCVYFLASPLTCKKGAECEYRHSEIARLNPRDCWYWLNGSCLNPKCAFRHPPLEGMLGPQVPAPSGPTLPPNQTATPVSSAPHNNSGKQAVPCIFFQQGFCLKGDRCPFSHGPAFANNTKPPQAPVSAPAFTKPPSTFKKPFLGIEKCSTDPSVVRETYVPPKSTIAPNQVKQSPTKDESTIERHARHSSSGVNDYNAPIYRPPAANGNLITRANRVQQQVHTPDDYDTTFNSKEPGEFSREPSPGFDVLVDDELREDDYYPEEGEYERTRSNEDRRLNPVNEYDIRRSVDYKDLDSMVDADRDTFHRYDSFNPTRGQYGRDQRRVSSERRRYPRGDSPDRVDGSDLRNRLSKHRKVNGLRSVISHDMDRDSSDHSYRGNSRRSTNYIMPAGERVGSDRFRGRIKLPGRSTSPPNGRERGNSRGRLSSPGRFQGGRVQDRIKGKVHEDTDTVARDFRGLRTGEMMYDQVNFAGPKSLSELRVKKGTEYNNKQPVNDYQRSVLERKRKYSENTQQVENFEGPKPLSEILKRKRGGDVHDQDSKKASKEEVGEDSKTVDVGNIERNNVIEDLQVEEGVIVEDEVDYDQEHEVAYADEGEGEYEYEPVEGDDYKEDEGGNVEEGGEYVEDDDGDDFAKKIGVMFS